MILYQHCFVIHIFYNFSYGWALPRNSHAPLHRSRGKILALFGRAPSAASRAAPARALSHAAKCNSFTCGAVAGAPCGSRRRGGANKRRLHAAPCLMAQISPRPRRGKTRSPLPCPRVDAADSAVASRSPELPDKHKTSPAPPLPHARMRRRWFRVVVPRTRMRRRLRRRAPRVREMIRQRMRGPGLQEKMKKKEKGKLGAG